MDDPRDLSFFFRSGFRFGKLDFPVHHHPEGTRISSGTSKTFGGIRKFTLSIEVLLVHAMSGGEHNFWMDERSSTSKLVVAGCLPENGGNPRKISVARR